MGNPSRHLHVCTLCEAACGLEITVDGDDVTLIRGDRDDVASHGFLCPKGTALKDLQNDPDRLRRPLVKRDGEFVETTFEEAFAEIERRLLPVREAGGPLSTGLVIETRSSTGPASSCTSRSSQRRLDPLTCSRRPRSIRCQSTYRSGGCSATATRFPCPISIERTCSS